MKTRILILSNRIVGLYAFRKEVIKAIAEAGYDVYISVPDKDECSKYFEDLGCHIIETNFNRRGTNPLADFKLMLEYVKLIRKLRPAKVLTYTIKPNVYGGIACRLTGAEQLANVTGLGDALENGGWLQKLTIFLYKMGLKKAQCVFFQNQSNREFCIQHKMVGKETVLLPGSGVNLNYHVYQQYPSQEDVTFLFIARLIKDKGTEEFFEMAKSIKAKHPNTRFQILGWNDGDYKQQLDELTETGIVEYLGVAHDVRPYLKEVHCTIMPSYHEGMSNVNLESEANGRPVITTNVPGCRETIDDGVTGYLVEVRSAVDLTEKVERFILLPHKEKVAMSMASRKKMERDFDRRIVIDAYMDKITKEKGC